MKFEGFDWDEGNWPKCGKHGISKEEIEDLFDNDPGTYADPSSSEAEQRLRAIGEGWNKRMMLVAFTTRETNGALLLRPISARYMHQKEISRYELDT
jgi:uncharacterized protein